MTAPVRTLVFFLLTTGLALADNRATFGPPVEAPADVEPPGAKAPILGAPVAAAEVVVPPVKPALVQFQMPFDRPPVVVPPEDRPNSSQRLWVDTEALLWWMRSPNRSMPLKG